MLVSVLASGSKGNSTLIKTNEYKILVDLGMTVKYLENKLRENEVLLKDINYILFTHTHKDHVSSLPVLLKRVNPTLIMSEKMYNDLPYLKDYKNIIFTEEEITLGNLNIDIIKTSHDSSDSRAYVVSEGAASVVVITDTGYLNQRHFNKLKNKSIYVFESNHDVEMLMHGPYPKWLKVRVLSDVGHLSNDAASFYLSKLIGPDTKKIILAHLSDKNNTPEIALKTCMDYFEQENINFNNIMVAKQNEQTELIEA